MSHPLQKLTVLDSKITKLVFFCILIIFSAFPSIAQEPGWWTKQKKDCGLDSRLAYNTWVAQGMPCHGQGTTSIPTGPSPEELRKQREIKDLKEASDDANDKGIDFYKKNDWANAIKYFKEALEYNPDNDDASDNLKKSLEQDYKESQRREAQRREAEIRKKEIAIQQEKKNAFQEKYNKYLWEADHIVVPPPSWESMIAEDIRQVRLGQNDNKYLIMADNAFVAAFDVVEKTPNTYQGAAVLVAFKLLIIGTKSVIAAQDEAEIIVFTKNARYERILILLKNKNRGPQLVAAIKCIRENKPLPMDTSPEIESLARETLNPDLGNSSTHLVMNAMLSNEAKAAFLQTAKMEGMEMLNGGLRAITGTMVQNRFSALRDVNEKIDKFQGMIAEEKDPVYKKMYQSFMEVYAKKMEPIEKIPEQILSLISLYDDNKKINEN